MWKSGWDVAHGSSTCPLLSLSCWGGVSAQQIPKCSSVVLQINTLLLLVGISSLASGAWGDRRGGCIAELLLTHHPPRPEQKNPVFLHSSCVAELPLTQHPTSGKILFFFTAVSIEAKTAAALHLLMPLRSFFTASPFSCCCLVCFFPCVLGGARDSRQDPLLLCGHVGEEKQTVRCKCGGFFPCLGVSCPGDAASPGETVYGAESQGKGRCCDGIKLVSCSSSSGCEDLGPTLPSSLSRGAEIIPVDAAGRWEEAAL